MERRLDRWVWAAIVAQLAMMGYVVTDNHVSEDTQLDEVADTLIAVGREASRPAA